jgi:hypothetical protein
VNIETIILGAFATIGSVGTIVLGIMKAREDRAVRQDANAATRESSVVTYLTNDVNYWRDRCTQQEIELAELRRELWSRTGDLEHAADVAQAALLTLQTAKRDMGRTTQSDPSD